MKTHLSTYIQPEKFTVPMPQIFEEQNTDGKVYFVDYDMVQMEMSRVAKSKLVNPTIFGKINVFNEYFGRGLSSIVFQEMRERKSLAYSAFVSYISGGQTNYSDYINTYIGTQPDKLPVAIQTLQDLMTELPQIPLQFDNAKNSVLRQIESGRIVRANKFLNFKNLNKLGIYHDYRENMYHEIEKLDLKQLTDFYNQEIKNLSYNTAIIGKKENLNREAISQFGELKELSLEEIFGY
jgi:predicted Zn-dependent peptidase